MRVVHAGTTSLVIAPGGRTAVRAFSNSSDPAISGAGDIAAGPDGALWFTNYRSSIGSSIGRITTAGTVTIYTDPSMRVPNGVAAGSDGAMWFTNYGNTPPDSEEIVSSIGRITTTGSV